MRNIRKIIESNINKGTCLWSQSYDTDWWRRNRDDVPESYFRLVATWPNGMLENESAPKGWLYVPRNLSAGTLTGFGREAYYCMDGGQDRSLTKYERSCLRKALLENGAEDPAEKIKDQVSDLKNLESLGLLTETELKTVSVIGGR
jgi:hypothetical protein